MIAILIAAASLMALFPLFVSHCGTVLSSARKVDLSDRVSALAEMSGRSVSADDFDRILQLVRLCPDHTADEASVRSIAIYHRLIHGLGRNFGEFSPSLADWTDRERADCSHFAAVVLDRCISSSRSLLTEQTGDNL